MTYSVTYIDDLATIFKGSPMVCVKDLTHHRSSESFSLSKDVLGDIDINKATLIYIYISKSEIER
jgi:hypothetical protein